MGTVSVFKPRPTSGFSYVNPSATGVNFAAQSKVLRLLFD